MQMADQGAPCAPRDSLTPDYVLKPVEPQNVRTAPTRQMSGAGIARQVPEGSPGLEVERETTSQANTGGLVFRTQRAVGAEHDVDLMTATSQGEAVLQHTDFNTAGRLE